MIRAYARVSTTEQAADDRSSMEQQRKRAEGVALLRGTTEITYYQDPGVSGATPLRARPDGARLLADLQSGDLVVAAKLDRLFRSASDALVTVEELKAKGVGVILADVGIDPVTENGAAKLFFSMLACFAEFERDRITERMRDGRRAKRARGGHVGGPAPYGFRREGEGRHAVLIPDQREQTVIELARTTRSFRGYGMRRISAHLAEVGYTARDGQPFQPQQIARMVAQ